MIRIFRGAEERTRRTAVRIKSCKGPIDDNERDAAQLSWKFDQHFFGDLVFGRFEKSAARAEAVGCPRYEVVLGPHFGRECPLLQADAVRREASFHKAPQYI